MACLKKKIVLMLFVLLIVFGLLFVEPCMAPVTVPTKPKSAPDIVSVEVHHRPQAYPPSYTTDPYTGNKQQTAPGGINQGGDIVIKIKNQPFTAYTDKNGKTINRYYSVFWKYSIYPWNDDPSFTSMQPYCEYQSNTAYTIITFRYGLTGQLDADYYLLYYTDEGVSLDFRVQAVEGYFEMFTVFEGEGSEFVEFTVNIPAATDKAGTFKPNIKPSSIAPSTSDSNNLSSSEPANPPPQTPWTTCLLIIAITTICLITIPLVIIAYHYGQRKNKAVTSQTAPSTAP